mgnify:FL=1
MDTHSTKGLMKVVIDDSSLEHYNSKITERYERYLAKKREIENVEGSVAEFAKGYEKFGIHKTPEGIVYKEWAPGASALCLFGDFNDWRRHEFQGSRDEFGVWTVQIPNKQGEYPIKHGQRLKAGLTLANGEQAERIPAWANYTVQNVETTLYDAVFWDPPTSYEWKYPLPDPPRSLKVYECHIGMSSEHGVVNTYTDFTEHVLPKIVETGYTAIQLMAIMEHVYYGSFGYHVTNFFAVSSRYGTPDDLKKLIDTAHSYGVYVFLDMIHSHASSNVLDGLNHFDGTDHQYFHEGGRGRHEMWDSRLFNYNHWEVMRFLLSNVRWYLEEYNFDGFRFDGVTSMLYRHHGIKFAFSGHYHEYFDDEKVDKEAHVYIMLANDLIHTLRPEAIVIAEDVSGMPTLCRPIEEGGFGFDYRLNMSVPDKWIQLLKEYRDEEWNMGNVAFTLTNRRWNEKCIAYAESHDQSIVGDKTIAMWLFDKEIYTNMALNSAYTPVVHRGLALHKMIRLITHALGGEAYLCFMGNEFGHPEWVDFPREGNGYSHHHCRRQWHLRDDPGLHYHYLWQFDKAMNNLENEYHWLVSKEQYISLAHEEDKIMVFERGPVLFVFNFHPSKSFEHYRVGTKWPYEHIILLDTDQKSFNGHDRLSHGHSNPFPIIKDPWHNRPNYIQLYLPSRCGIVLRPLIEDEERSKFGLPSLRQQAREEVPPSEEVAKPIMTTSQLSR